jgi:hypothetical protein
MEDFMAGYDMTTGNRLWIKDFGFAVVAGASRYDPTSDEYGIVGFFDTVAMNYVAFDVKTGNKLWESDPGFDYPWGSSYPPVASAGDKWYTYNTDGYVRCYEFATGKQVWKTHIGATNETIYGTWPGFSVQSGGAGSSLRSFGGADKTLFVSTGISWGTQPFTRFHKLRAYDMDIGDLLWSIPGIYVPIIVADGYLVAGNSADGKLYTFGKGKTETTVTIQDDVIAEGSSVLIKGTIMDMSPAQPNTPAVAKESMDEWMEYLHMQNATLINNPPCPKGVPVQLMALNPDGSITNLITVTSDMYGQFSHLYTPTTKGTYTIVAAFDGDDSYWSSSAATDIAVTEAPSPAVPIEPEEPAPLITTEIAIIIAVVVVAVIGIAAYWLLRKRS